MGIWQRGAPWGALLPILGAVLFGALLVCGYALSARMRNWGSATRLVRVIIAWFVGAIAGVVTAAVWDLAAVLAEAEQEPLGLQWVFREHLPEFLGSAIVGLVWGWLPALVLARFGTPMDRKAAVWMSVTALLVAATASIVIVSGLPASTRQDRVAQGLSPVYHPVTPSPTPRPQPPSRVAPTPVAPAADWCTDADTTISASGMEGALSHRAITLVLVNQSAASCVVEGYPDVAFASSEGGELNVPVTHGSSYLAQDPGPHAVTLSPGTTAKATLSWVAGEQGDSASSMLVAPYAGAIRSTLDTQTGITDGTSVSVTAWESGATH
ncbi:hypothetical protein GCM10027568_09350 [Humibacter soli]